jgi:hypothetical protein
LKVGIRQKPLVVLGDDALGFLDRLIDGWIDSRFDRSAQGKLATQPKTPAQPKPVTPDF